ncbi:hypothetical protein INR49_017077 [Caranx melampygus]|nr:hypothetical protein INR49_017077 [Caranx melampygus]
MLSVYPSDVHEKGLQQAARAQQEGSPLTRLWLKTLFCIDVTCTVCETQSDITPPPPPPQSPPTRLCESVASSHCPPRCAFVECIIIEPS